MEICPSLRNCSSNGEEVNERDGGASETGGPAQEAEGPRGEKNSLRDDSQARTRRYIGAKHIRRLPTPAAIYQRFWDGKDRRL